MQPVLQLISRVGPSDANVLITGEPGTGKEVVAQTLHAISERASKPLVTVNAGGFAEGIFESELFGHVKGAFTDAKTGSRRPLRTGRRRHAVSRRNCERSFNLQSKLLRVLETGEMERVGSSKTKRVNARILSATNANLGGGGRIRPLSRGSAVPAEHDRNPSAAAYASARKIFRCSRRISSASMRSGIGSG